MIEKKKSEQLSAQFSKRTGMFAFSPSAWKGVSLHEQRMMRHVFRRLPLHMVIYNIYHLKMTNLKSMHTCRPLGSPRLSLRPQTQALPLVHCAVPL